MNLDIIGHSEVIDLIDYDTLNVPSRIDTGADSSSIWASNVTETKNGLTYTLFDRKSPLYAGTVITIPKNYKRVWIINSFGQKELRYKVKLRIRVKGKIIKATFTLSDRSNNTFPVLLGRRLLRNKFIVDVSQGQVNLKKPTLAIKDSAKEEKS
jgi:hypothetical protein